MPGLTSLERAPTPPRARPAPMPTLETESDFHPGEPVSIAFIGQFVGLERSCSGPHKAHMPLSTFLPLNTPEV